MHQGIKRELENLSSFVEKQKALMSLYVSVHGCKPTSYEEFDKWCELYEANSRTTNSRGPIMDIYLANEKNDASF